MTPLWIVVIVFIVVAAGAAIVMLATAWGDKRVSDEVASDPGRLHADPRDDLDGEHDRH